MNQNQTPLYTKLVEHHQNHKETFHVPGHKFGKVYPQFAEKQFSGILSIDATELAGLDDLHDPSGVIKEAQDLLSDWYRTIKSYFLIGGSTSGNLAAILATLKQGDYVIVQRNSHKSIFHGLELVGATPILVNPMYDDVAKVASGVELSSINKAIADYPNVRGAIFTNPNYYGMSVDLTSIIDILHKHDIPVIVDEAHGAHFDLGSPFPKSALTSGADIVIQSAHKTLPAMTMGAYLHVNSHRISMERLEHFSQVIQSSSPSYPIMASLDLARHYLASLTEEKINETIDSIGQLKREVDAIPQIKRVNPVDNRVRFDPLKMIIQSNSTFTGFTLQKRLESKGIYTELADPNNVLFIFGLAPIREYRETLVKILNDCVKDDQVGSDRKSHEYHGINEITTLSLTFEEMGLLDTEILPLSRVEGKIAAQSIIPYPPGIPVLMKGERITEPCLNQMKHLYNSGARFQMGQDIFKEGIRVYNTSK